MKTWSVPLRMSTVIVALLLVTCALTARAKTPQVPAPRPWTEPTNPPHVPATTDHVPALPGSALSPLAPTDAPAEPTPVPATEPSPAETPEVRKGYGISVKGLNFDDDSLDKAIALGFEWIKIYDYPPPERLPFRVLYRVNLPLPDEDWEQWAHYRFLDAELYKGRIDAYEIGNEPNLIEEWGHDPDPAAYAELLKLAYSTIKSADPDALIVSAGLAPVGATGDPRHVNDLAFLRGMYENGAAGAFDVLGMHPFGFAYMPETAPDAEACDPPSNSFKLRYVRVEGPALNRECWSVDGLCFRRAEELRAIMVEHGDAGKPVWATEFGWIIDPPPCCLTRSDWPLRQWQAVSERAQARYIVDAFAYAQDNWPWMEAMFLWNLDYGRYSRGKDKVCPYCESMGWYGILNSDGSPRLAYKWLLER
jgi:hypothetical protein